MSSKCKIKSGDTVQVLSGKDRTKRAKVSRVLPARRQVLVEGINVVKKHQKPRSAQKPGEIIEKNMPLPISRVQLVCPHCNKGTRVGYELKADSKQRICRKCQKIIN